MSEQLRQAWQRGKQVYANSMYESAMVAPIRKQPCTGLSGKLCTCGQWHTAYSQPEKGLLVSKWFWIGGAASLAVWAALAWWLA